ncbi:hypothetical protein [Pygmaiobacter massiliensis]|uniref:hypothetical protein n=1 Tax=Pygmaiobacter massiliensis TaxID=1917873 RepID=UPI000C7E4EC8|nr:hypothetical protein [Pygmaiobacter massiliensis]
MKLILPVLSGIIFLLCIYRFTIRLFKPEDAPNTSDDKLDWKTVSALMAIVSVAWVAFIFLYAMLKNPSYTLDESLKDVFIQLDVNHYVNIAQFGYGTGEAFHEQELMIAFFPLWPLLLKLVHFIIPIGWYVLGTLLQIPIFIVGMTMFYVVASKYYDQPTSKLALILLLVSPGAFFFLSPMTESLFFALCMVSLWALQSRKLWVFVIASYAAALTRSPGVLLAVPAIIMAAQGFKNKSGIARWGTYLVSASGPVLGIATYLLINFKVYGNWLAYSEFQRDHWGQGLGIFCNTIKYHQEYFWGGLKDNIKFAVLVSLMAVLVIMAQLISTWWGSKKVPTHLGFYSLAYIALVDGATWLLSAPRYALCLPFVHLSIADKLRTPIRKALVLVPLSMVSILYLIEFLERAPIY